MATARRHSRQDLYGSASRSSQVQGMVRATRGRSPSELSQSEHIPSSDERCKQGRGTVKRMASTRNGPRQEDGHSIGAEDEDRDKDAGSAQIGRSQLYSRERPERKRASSAGRRRSTPRSSTGDLSRYYRDGSSEGNTAIMKNDREQKRASSTGRRRSTRASTGDLSRYKDRSTEGNTTTITMKNADFRIASSSDRRQRSSRHQETSTMVSATTSSRRRRSRTPLGLHADDSKDSRRVATEIRESVQSFFGSTGGSGIVGGDNKRNRDAPVLSARQGSSVDVISPRSNIGRGGTKLDIRRETGQRMMQKFKPTRNLNAGVLDDLLK